MTNDLEAMPYGSPPYPPPRPLHFQKKFLSEWLKNDMTRSAKAIHNSTFPPLKVKHTFL